MKNLLIFICMLLVSGSGLLAQPENLTTKNKKAEKLYREAYIAFEKYDYNEAEKKFQESIELDSTFIEAYMMLGTLYEETRYYEKAIIYYAKAVAIDEDFFPSTLYTLGQLELRYGYYAEAKYHFERLLTKKKLSPAAVKTASEGIIQCQFALDQIANPKPFDPLNMGDDVNSVYQEYNPALTADESVIIFTRLVPKSGTSSKYSQEDFYIAFKENGSWTTAAPMSNVLNSPGNEGAHTISPDGQLLYFTACNREDGLGSCDIYVSKRQGNGWSTPYNIREINSVAWDSQPSIGPDGRTLYFSSARDGNMDIYVTHMDEKGKWSTPVSVGAPINTNNSEQTAFIHPDGKTLYFTSMGHMGMGGYDIYYSRMQEDGSWGVPVNIGYPINTYKDEVSLFVSTSGETAYFSSDKKGGVGEYDIYSFALYEEARPTNVTYLKGSVRDSITGQALKASFELRDLTSGEIIAQSSSNEDGSFLICIPSNRNYALNVNKEGYLFYSANFQLSGIHSISEPYARDIAMQPIQKDQRVILRNIFFDTDKFELKPESFVELNTLLTLLKNNVGLRIEISGHTDNTGSKEHNRVLSENRAKAVYDYLISQGIAANRMTYRGYGDSQPISDNNTEEGRALNRRTEFKVL